MSLDPLGIFLKMVSHQYRVFKWEQFLMVVVRTGWLEGKVMEGGICYY